MSVKAEELWSLLAGGSKRVMPVNGGGLLALSTYHTRYFTVSKPMLMLRLHFHPRRSKLGVILTPYRVCEVVLFVGGGGGGLQESRLENCCILPGTCCGGCLLTLSSAHVRLFANLQNLVQSRAYNTLLTTHPFSHHSALLVQSFPVAFSLLVVLFFFKEYFESFLAAL